MNDYKKTLTKARHLRFKAHNQSLIHLVVDRAGGFSTEVSFGDINIYLLLLKALPVIPKDHTCTYIILAYIRVCGVHPGGINYWIYQLLIIIQIIIIIIISIHNHPFPYESALKPL